MKHAQLNSQWNI